MTTGRVYRPLEGKIALIVEDNYLIAMDLEDALVEFGASAVQTAHTNEDALAMIGVGSPDVAILDFNLGSSTAASVAEELIRRNIPVLLATGDNEFAAAPEALANVPILAKPYNRDMLAEAIERLLKGRAPPR